MMESNPYAAPAADPKPPPPTVRKRTASLGMVAVLMAVLASSWLLIAVAHVRSDRTNRRPVVASVGPLAGHITEVTWAALGVSLVALILAYTVMERTKRSHSTAAFAILVAVANLIVTAIVAVALYED